MHVGCMASVMPSWANMYGCAVGQNKVQKMFWEQWRNMCNEHYDVVFVLGDSVNGKNKKSDGVGNWTNDIDLRIEHAAGMLRMIDADVFVGVQGSDYHVGSNGSADRNVMDLIGGTFDIDKHVEVDGVDFHLKHAVGTSSTLKGRGTSLNGDLEAMKMYPETYGNVDVALRGHAHYLHFIGWEDMLGVIAPAWKWKDGFMRKGKVTYGNDCGYLVFECDDGEYTWSAHSFKVPYEIAVDKLKI